VFQHSQALTCTHLCCRSHHFHFDTTGGNLRRHSQARKQSQQHDPHYHAIPSYWATSSLWNISHQIPLYTQWSHCYYLQKHTSVVHFNSYSNIIIYILSRLARPCRALQLYLFFVEASNFLQTKHLCECVRLFFCCMRQSQYTPFANWFANFQ